MLDVMQKIHLDVLELFYQIPILFSKKKGFKFVGPVCIYSYLQAAGLINDHEVDCDFNPKK